MSKSLAEHAGAKTGARRKGAGLADEQETAEYIGDLVRQLEKLAATHGLVKLEYLLAACREEAQEIVAGVGVRP